MSSAQAFCGFYVAKADAQLFNKASKVVVARKDNRTVVTMASDYQGDPQEFALVIPVPTVVTKEQIKISDNKLVDQLDAYSAPRLVEYFDPNPCAPPPMALAAAKRMMSAADAVGMVREERAKALGVTVEAEYTVGEYDILILSAKESDGLQTWLTDSGYKMPRGATKVLASYIKQDMKFFVAKVNLKEKAKIGSPFLRPIQVSYDTTRFMLPIRLGTVNASGPQDMFVFMLTQRGRVETTNYRTLRIPTGIDVPIYTKTEFGPFYKALFDNEVRKDGMRGVYLEYAWDISPQQGMKCDPCVAPLIPEQQLVELGATWLTGDGAGFGRGGPQTHAFFTRLHVRYDADHFPEDLMFQETSDTANFQGRYILRHPYTGNPTCREGEAYAKTLAPRFETEATNLARLTGWNINQIRSKMASTGQLAPQADPKAGFDNTWRPGKP